MRTISRISLFAFVVALSLHVGHDVLHAQIYGPNWKKIWTAPNADLITAIHFFDERSGLVAHSGHVYVTTDGGVSWRSSKLKEVDAQGGVRDFYFKDRKNGYAAYSSFTITAQPPKDGVFRTTDGGLSWQPVPNTVHRNSVFEAAGGNLLFASGRLQAIDSLRVIASCAHIGMWGYPHFSFFRTIDGGQNWDKLALKDESWGLYYQRTSGKFFCYPENKSRILVSSDFGNSWTPIPHDVGEVTGDIQGSADAIYVQTNVGMFRSLDQGQNFASIGGPGNHFDTRFSVPPACDGGIVVAADETSLWITVNGGDGGLGPSATPTIEGQFTTQASPCTPSTLSFLLKNRRCEDLIISSAILEAGASDFSLAPIALPVTLHGNDSLRFNLSFSGSVPGLPSTGRVRIRGFFTSSKSNTPFDTTVILTGDLVEDALGLEAATSDLQFGKITNCDACDTLVTLTNLACDSLVILSQQLIGGYFVYEPLDLPLSLAPGEKRDVRVRCAIDRSGTVRSQLLFVAQVGRSRSFDSVRVGLLGAAIVNTPVIKIEDDTIDLGAVTLCNVRDTITEIINLGCDSVSIHDAAVNAPFSFSALSSPSLGRGDSYELAIHFQPTRLGTFIQAVDIDGERFGRLGRITVILKGTAIPSEDRPQISVNTIAFAPISKCSLDSASFDLKDIGCDPIEVISIDRTGDADFALRDQPPFTLQPGETRSVRVLLTPIAAGNRSATLQLKTRTALGGFRDTTIKLSAEIFDGARSLVASTQSLDMGSHSVCDDISSTVTLSNPGCDTLTIAASDIQGSFDLTNVTFPIRLSPGGSITLTVESKLDTAGARSSSSGSISFESNSDTPLPPITLSRSYLYPRSIVIGTNALSPASSHESESMSFTLNAIGDLSDISTLDLDLVYDADLLSDVSLSNGSIVSKNSTSNGLTSHRIRLTPPFTNELLRFTATVRLAVNAETPISVERITLNGDDPRFQECIARATASDTSRFTFLYNCGDRTLQDALRRGSSAVRIISLRPNPVDDKLMLDVASETDVSVEVLDALGKLVVQTSGHDHFEIDTRDLASGVFFLKVTGPLGSQVRSLVKR